MFRRISYPEDRHTAQATTLIIDNLLPEAIKVHDRSSLLIDLIGDCLNYCIEIDDELFAIGSLCTAYFSRSVALIDSVAVVPEQRGKGLGSELIAGLEKEALSLGNTDVALRSLESSTGFYRSQGYHPLIIDDDLWLGKTLTSSDRSPTTLELIT